MINFLLTILMWYGIVTGGCLILLFALIAYERLVYGEYPTYEDSASSVDYYSDLTTDEELV